MANQGDAMQYSRKRRKGYASGGCVLVILKGSGLYSGKRVVVVVAVMPVSCAKLT